MKTTKTKRTETTLRKNYNNIEYDKRKDSVLLKEFLKNSPKTKEDSDRWVSLRTGIDMDFINRVRSNIRYTLKQTDPNSKWYFFTHFKKQRDTVYVSGFLLNLDTWESAEVKWTDVNKINEKLENLLTVAFPFERNYGRIPYTEVERYHKSKRQEQKEKEETNKKRKTLQALLEITEKRDNAWYGERA